MTSISPARHPSSMPPTATSAPISPSDNRRWAALVRKMRSIDFSIPTYFKGNNVDEVNPGGDVLAANRHTVIGSVNSNNLNLIEGTTAAKAKSDQNGSDSSSTNTTRSAASYENEKDRDTHCVPYGLPTSVEASRHKNSYRSKESQPCRNATEPADTGKKGLNRKGGSVACCGNSWSSWPQRVGLGMSRFVRWLSSSVAAVYSRLRTRIKQHPIAFAIITAACAVSLLILLLVLFLVILPAVVQRAMNSTVFILKRSTIQLPGEDTFTLTVDAEILRDTQIAAEIQSFNADVLYSPVNLPSVMASRSLMATASKGCLQSIASVVGAAGGSIATTNTIKGDWSPQRALEAAEYRYHPKQYQNKEGDTTQYNQHQHQHQQQHLRFDDGSGWGEIREAARIEGSQGCAGDVVRRALQLREGDSGKGAKRKEALSDGTSFPLVIGMLELPPITIMGTSSTVQFTTTFHVRDSFGFNYFVRELLSAGQASWRLQGLTTIRAAGLVFPAMAFEKELLVTGPVLSQSPPINNTRLPYTYRESVPPASNGVINLKPSQPTFRVIEVDMSASTALTTRLRVLVEFNNADGTTMVDPLGVLTMDTRYKGERVSLMRSVGENLVLAPGINIYEFRGVIHRVDGSNVSGYISDGSDESDDSYYMGDGRDVSGSQLEDDRRDYSRLEANTGYSGDDVERRDWQKREVALTEFFTLVMKGEAPMIESTGLGSSIPLYTPAIQSIRLYTPLDLGSGERINGNNDSQEDGSGFSIEETPTPSDAELISGAIIRSMRIKSINLVPNPLDDNQLAIQGEINFVIGNPLGPSCPMSIPLVTLTGEMRSGGNQTNNFEVDNGLVNSQPIVAEFKGTLAGIGRSEPLFNETTGEPLGDMVGGKMPISFQSLDFEMNLFLHLIHMGGEFEKFAGEFIRSTSTTLKLVNVDAEMETRSSLGRMVLRGLPLDQDMELEGFGGMTGVEVVDFKVQGLSSSQQGGFSLFVSVSVPSPTTTLYLGDIYVELTYKGSHVAYLTSPESQLKQGGSVFNFTGDIRIRDVSVTKLFPFLQACLLGYGTEVDIEFVEKPPEPPPSVVSSLYPRPAEGDQESDFDPIDLTLAATNARGQLDPPLWLQKALIGTKMKVQIPPRSQSSTDSGQQNGGGAVISQLLGSLGSLLLGGLQAPRPPQTTPPPVLHPVGLPRSTSVGGGGGGGGGIISGSLSDAFSGVASPQASSIEGRRVQPQGGVEPEVNTAMNGQSDRGRRTEEGPWQQQTTAGVQERPFKKLLSTFLDGVQRGMAAANAAGSPVV